MTVFKWYRKWREHQLRVEIYLSDIAQSLDGIEKLLTEIRDTP